MDTPLRHRYRGFRLADLAQQIGDATQFERDIDHRLCQAGATFISTFDIERLFIEYGKPPKRAVFHKFGRFKQSKAGTSCKEEDTKDFAIIGDHVGLTEDRLDTVQYIELHHVKGILCVLETEMKTEYGAYRPPRILSGKIFLELSENKRDRFVSYSRFDRLEEQLPIVIDVEDIQVICRLTQVLLGFRERIFANFPYLISQAYLDHEIYRRLEVPGKNVAALPAMIPPWQRPEGNTYTCTLALDLRRSTFGMDLASSPKSYADWIEAFVLILKTISGDNLGVFDKFTGDGAIVHFMADDCEGLCRKGPDVEPRKIRRGTDAARLAVKCGWEMIYALGCHMRCLERILKLHNKHLGPAIGIAIDEACWSVDRYGNPIVLGPGVVHACRAGDGAPANTMRLTPITLTLLDEMVPGTPLAYQVPFETKEYKADAGVRIFEMQQPPFGLCRPHTELEGICREIYTDLKQRGNETADTEWMFV